MNCCPIRQSNVTGLVWIPGEGAEPPRAQTGRQDSLSYPTFSRRIPSCLYCRPPFEAISCRLEAELEKTALPVSSSIGAFAASTSFSWMTLWNA